VPDLQLNLFVNLSGHINAPTGRTPMIYNLDSTADNREQSRGPREIAGHCNGSLLVSIQFVYSFQIIVPVVRRKEQGFPNPNGFPWNEANRLSGSRQEAPKSATR
jgi:hypothetical protein